MVSYGFHASHEQFAPSHLLGLARQAVDAGFEGVMCSDHLMPWSERQGQSGFALSWLGAAMQAVPDVPFGVVTAPGQRYHPVIVAQAAATLAEMFPGRFWMALGSGEAVNEHVTGDVWPPKPIRRDRLRECVDIMRALFAGETVEHDGLVRASQARLYVRPEQPPLLVAAAVSADSARWAAGWADAVVTVNQRPDALRRLIDAWRQGGGEGKPMRLQVHVCLGTDRDEALAEAHHQWRSGVLGGDVPWDVAMPEQFDAITETVRPEDLDGPVLVSTEPDELAAAINDYVELGFEQVNVHHVGRDQERFIDTFAERVLPQLKR